MTTPHSRLPVHPDQLAQSDEDHRLVRSYIVTGGRTSTPTATDLPLEALVSLTATGQLMPDLQYERGIIAALCQEVLSVAEVAAHTQLPLGVTRVLLADMRDEGLLDVHVPRQGTGRPDAALLEKVLDGLHSV